jgi:hypothetical protein
MDIDWVVAAGVFFLLVGWSFGYYMGFFGVPAAAAGEPTGVLTDAILASLSMGVSCFPAEYNSTAAGVAVLYLEYGWPDGNGSSARVFGDGRPLECRLSGDTLYWVADLSEGRNMFEVVYGDSDDVNCSGTFDTSGALQATGWAASRESVLSPERVERMTDQGYASFARSVGAARDFRVVIDSPGSTVSYGPPEPASGDVFVDEAWVRSGWQREPARLTVYSWQSGR